MHPYFHRYVPSRKVRIISNIFSYFILGSAVSFWIFLIMTFVFPADVPIVGDLIYWSGLMFWLYGLPLQIQFALFIVAILVFGYFLRKFREKYKL